MSIKIEDVLAGLNVIDYIVGLLRRGQSGEMTSEQYNTEMAGISERFASADALWERAAQRDAEAREEENGGVAGA